MARGLSRVARGLSMEAVEAMMISRLINSRRQLPVNRFMKRQKSGFKCFFKVFKVVFAMLLLIFENLSKVSTVVHLKDM